MHHSRWTTLLALSWVMVGCTEGPPEAMPEEAMPEEESATITWAERWTTEVDLGDGKTLAMASDRMGANTALLSGPVVGHVDETGVAMRWVGPPVGVAASGLRGDGMIVAITHLFNLWAIDPTAGGEPAAPSGCDTEGSCVQPESLPEGGIYPTAVGADATGSVYVAGIYGQDATAFQPPPPVQSGIFIARMDEAGTVLAIRDTGLFQSSSAAGCELAIDPAGGEHLVACPEAAFRFDPQELAVTWTREWAPGIVSIGCGFGADGAIHLFGEQALPVPELGLDEPRSVFAVELAPDGDQRWVWQPAVPAAPATRGHVHVSSDGTVAAWFSWTEVLVPSEPVDPTCPESPDEYDPSCEYTEEESRPWQRLIMTEPSTGATGLVDEPDEAGTSRVLALTSSPTTLTIARPTSPPEASPSALGLVEIQQLERLP